jgi:hypothetical protein
MAERKPYEPNQYTFNLFIGVLIGKMLKGEISVITTTKK